MLIATSSGQALFRYQDTNSGSLFYGAASISNGVLYVGNRDGHLYTLGT
jgi:outer membrane protein assembly factor BamB